MFTAKDLSKMYAEGQKEKTLYYLPIPAIQQSIDKNEFIFDDNGFIRYHFSKRECVVILKEIFVKNEKRKSGIGKKLLAQLEQIAINHKVATIRLETEEHNINAQAFYEKNMFKLIKSRETKVKLLIYEKILPTSNNLNRWFK